MPPFGFFASRNGLFGSRFFAIALAFAPPTSGADVNCVDRLQIQGNTAGELRARLRFGRLSHSDSPACDSVVVRVRTQKNGYLLTLSLGEQTTQRTVRSINDAATWSESWLEPIVSERTTTTEIHTARVPSSAAILKAEPAKEPHAAADGPSLLFAMGPELTIGSDESVKLGPSVFGQSRVTPHFWIGVNVGYAWQLSDAWKRRLLRGSLLVGPAWDLNSRVSLTPGIGIGFYSGRMLDPTSTSGQSMQTGGGYLELHSRVTLAISEHWSLSGALGGRWYAFSSKGKLVVGETDDDEEETHTATSMPREVPLLEFTTALGLCYRWGGTS